jgi:acyl-CoA synthetase (AMP-forming)/AMP-acid ligase II
MIDQTELPLTIPAALASAADQHGNLEAVVEDDQRLSFSTLHNMVEETASAIIATGIESGDRVAIWAPNSLPWVVASFAIYAAGAVLVPVNTRFKGEEAGHILRKSGAKMLITVSDFLGTDYLEMLDGVAGLDALEEKVTFDGPGWASLVNRAGPPLPTVTPDQVSDIIFTSGTTGAPKGAMLTHQASVRTYWAWSERVGLRRGDRYLVVYPFFHTAGLKSGVLASVLRGATIVPHAVFDVPAVIRRVAEERISVLPGPPTVFQSIMNHPDLAHFDLSTIRLGLTGAASTPVEVVRRMRDDLHIETVVTGYGLTETTGTVSMCRHDDPPEIIAGTVGRPLDGVEVRIDGERGQAGEILVRGFNVMKGYFEDPEATALAIDEDGWLHTGDVGTIDEAGNIRITDRKKDMYIVGGFNVYPAEVEGIMTRHPAVAQVAVVGVGDPRLGEVGKAFVIPRAGMTLDPDELIEWCRANMANFKVPRYVEAVESLPLNPSGKVMKFVLREKSGL